MTFSIVRNDITKMKTTAIVNTANPLAAVGNGVDSAVYEAAGFDRLFEKRRAIGELAPGTSAVTPGYDLDAEYIIHTVGPVWVDGRHGEFETLRNCYSSALELALSLNCSSLAFPMISTGTYGFPKDKALQTAVSVISGFLMEHDMEIYLVVFDRRAYQLSRQLQDEVEQFIDESYAAGHSGRKPAVHAHGEGGRVQECARNYQNGSAGSGVQAGNAEAAEIESNGVCLEEKAESLNDVLEHSEDTFSERLFKLIDRSGLTDAEVYKRANIDRKLFSKIRCHADYSPKKKTAMALAVALKLNISETGDLLARAGYAMSPSSKFDVIVTYFIQKGQYDIFRINECLFNYTGSGLGI